MKWRIFRLPGSRETWLIDHGPGSVVLACETWDHGAGITMRSINGNPAATPRAWIEVSESELLLVGDPGKRHAQFTAAAKAA